MKNVVVDSSSIILLQKCALLSDFVENYSVILAKSVFEELMRKDKEGVSELFDLFHDRVVLSQVCPIHELNMGCGERDTIGLALEGYGDFILVDDKKGAIYCMKVGIPFINSLLVPRIFFAAGLLSKSRSREKIQQLASIGYYSKIIVERAKEVSEERIKYFLP